MDRMDGHGRVATVGKLSQIGSLDESERMTRSSLTAWISAMAILLAYALTWSIAVPMMLSSRGYISMHLPEWLEGLAAFGPFVAALIVAKAIGPEGQLPTVWRSLSRWNVGGIWILFSILSPVVLLLLAVGLTGAVLAPIDFQNEGGVGEGSRANHRFGLGVHQAQGNVTRPVVGDEPSHQLAGGLTRFATGNRHQRNDDVRP